jgi:hypothetical protein
VTEPQQEENDTYLQISISADFFDLYISCVIGEPNL